MTNSGSDYARQAPRVRVDLFVNQVFHDEVKIARVRDISATGIYLKDLLVPPFDTEDITIEIKLPDYQESIWVTGHIVRTDEDDEQNTGLALKFTKISNYDQQLLQEFVAKKRGTAID